MSDDRINSVSIVVTLRQLIRGASFRGGKLPEYHSGL